MEPNTENMFYNAHLQNFQSYPNPSLTLNRFAMIEGIEGMEQPTDLSSSSNQDTSGETISEQSILDLSCKRTIVSPTSSRNDDPDASQSIKEELSPATVHEENVQSRKRRRTDSPMERRYEMLTSSSESDLSNRNEYEENSLNVLATNNNNEKLPLHLPMNVPAPIPIPIMPSILPTLLTSNLLEQNKNRMINTNIQLPIVTTATIAPNNLHPQESPRKMPRPFKAYPLNIPTNQPDLILTQGNNETYEKFRARVLTSVKRQSETANVKMRRTNKTSSSAVPTSTVEEKDAAYWERRKKNNEAAKRSRDARRAKEDEIAIRAAFLEQENHRLKCELAALRSETAKLHCMLYSPK